jgi:hypothetical protein
MKNVEICGDTLNDDWIRDYENTDKMYHDFYKDDLYYINIHYMYINKDNEIDKINSESFIMSQPNCITREEILGILKKNTMNNNKTKQYSLLSILKYNIFLNEQDISSFLKCDSSYLDNYNEAFLTSVKNIDSIYFDKTIHMFHDLNDLFIIFYENPKQHNQTHNVTKKIYLNHSSHRKTIKNNIKIK